MSKDLMKLIITMVAITLAQSKPYVPVLNGVEMEYACTDVPGGVTRPRAIYNSVYYIDREGGLCCPLNAGYCEYTREQMIQKCASLGYGVNDGPEEPCAHCYTCARNIGESCYGPQGIQGLCNTKDGLECDGHEDNENKTGVCVSKNPVLKKIGENCGGRLDSIGVCEDGLVCTEVNEGKHRVCVMGGT
jgi:hypothetical protein